MSDQRNPYPYGRGGDEQKRSVTGKVHVDGQIEVHVPPEIHEQNKTEQDKRDSRDRSKMFIDGITLFFVIVVACINGRQLHFASEANTINRESLESTQRAYIAAAPVTGVNGAHGTSPATVEIRARYENSGSTPALDVVSAQSVNLQPEEPSEGEFLDIAETYQGQSPAILAAKGHTESQPKAIPQEAVFGYDYSAAKSPETGTTHVLQGHWYVWAWARYRDVFKGSAIHVTEYCGVLLDIAIAIDKSQPPGFYYAPCKSHNCVDEYCEDYETVKNAKLER